ncbi:pentapeptide repeat-containing protein [Hyella patelloides]|nr:pentapeptide repeat-containing protein [Hyella patelloides]
MNINDNRHHKLLGEILVEAGLISIIQIETALGEQLKNDLKIGEILISHGWIKQSTIDFFLEEWPKIIKSDKKKSLIFYLLKSGLINTKIVKDLAFKHKQKKSYKNKKDSFYELIIKEGYIEKITIDYFQINLFNNSNFNIYHFTEPYKILKNYIKGETDFKQSQLIKARLKGITLKDVKLDKSDFRCADLRSCNLSFSSLTQSNLNWADLHKAVLCGVNLRQSWLQQANLKESCLEKVNFHGANLKFANLRNAYLLKASFSNADLRGAKLASHYPYDVYYNSKTRFDDDFDPIAAGWIKK